MKAPKTGRLRITSDLVKEALFNILGPMEGLAFLDMFAGSGNVGIEALSRGARPVVFVERDSRHLATARQNLDTCGFGGGFEIIAASYERSLKGLGERGDRFDVIFADPPYDKGLVESFLDNLAGSPILSRDCVVVAEHSSREACLGNEGLEVYDERTYGDTVLSFLKPTYR